MVLLIPSAGMTGVRPGPPLLFPVTDTVNQSRHFFLLESAFDKNTAVSSDLSAVLSAD